MTAMSDSAPTSETPRQLRLSAAALVIANLVPLAGVLLWQWSVSSIVILYWFENVVIGVVNVLRMATASPASLDLRALASDLLLQGGAPGLRLQTFQQRIDELSRVGSDGDLRREVRVEHGRIDVDMNQRSGGVDPVASRPDLAEATSDGQRDVTRRGQLARERRCGLSEAGPEPQRVALGKNPLPLKGRRDRCVECLGQAFVGVADHDPEPHRETPLGGQALERVHLLDRRTRILKARDPLRQGLSTRELRPSREDLRPSMLLRDSSDQPGGTLAKRPDFVRAQANLVLVDRAIADKHAELQALKKVSPNHLVVRLAGPMIEEEYKTAQELKGALTN